MVYIVLFVLFNTISLLVLWVNGHRLKFSQGFHLRFVEHHQGRLHRIQLLERWIFENLPIHISRQNIHRSSTIQLEFNWRIIQDQMSEDFFSVLGFVDGQD